MHAQTQFRSEAHHLTAEASEDGTVGMGVVHQILSTWDGAMLHQMTLAVGDANPLSFNAPRRQPIMLTYSIGGPASSFLQLKTPCKDAVHHHQMSLAGIYLSMHLQYFLLKRTAKPYRDSQDISL